MIHAIKNKQIMDISGLNDNEAMEFQINSSERNLGFGKSEIHPFSQSQPLPWRWEGWEQRHYEAFAV